MILYCGENISPSLPEALREQGYDARSFRSMQWLGRLDVDLLPLVGEFDDALVLSRDRAMLDDTDELEAIVASRVGIVFLTSGQQSTESMVQIVVDSWGKLEELHENTPRPFVRFLTTTGTIRERFHGRGL